MQTTITSSQALWYINPGQAELRSEPIPTSTTTQDCLVKGVYSAISRGTESLIFQGLVPESEYERMRAPWMGGNFPFPVKYGYCHVGQVQEGPEQLLGKYVFSLSPHQTWLRLPASALVPIPDSVSPARAALAANMETALNGVWTGKPGPADRIAIVGGGLVGLLIAYLCSHLPGTEVTVIDPMRSRESICRKLGIRYMPTADAVSNIDVVFHTSASAAGLACALEIAGNEATVVELSWYGNKMVSVPLGQTFHSQQIRLLSCQVGHIEASHRPRWDYQRRLTSAVALLTDERLDCLLEPAIALETLPTHLPAILTPGADRLCQLIALS